jgi:hypothetical protein
MACGKHGVDYLALGRLLLRKRNSYDIILFFNVDGGFAQFWWWLPLMKVLRKPTVARFTIASRADQMEKRFGTNHHHLDCADQVD